MKNIAKTIAGVAVAIMLIDFMGFTAWVASGQHPVDNFYIGSITAHVLQAIIK